MPQFEFDIHTHTIASGHGSTATITDMVKAASKNGLTMLGLSDHGPSTPGGGRISYFRSITCSQRERLGIEMLYGAETSILNTKGRLDLPNSVLKNLDFAIASIHHPAMKPGSVEENTDAYIAAIKNPYISIIGHCDDTKFPVNYLTIVRAAMKHHVLLEINNNSLRPDGYRGDTKFNDLMILNLCKHFNYPVIFSSDSHGTKHVGDFTYALETAKLAGMPAELILNYSKERFLEFIKKI